MVWGYWAFAGFCLALAVLLPRMETGWAFCIALGGSGLIQASTRRLLLTQPIRGGQASAG
jgi:hypothetical protein